MALEKEKANSVLYQLCTLGLLQKQANKTYPSA
jgi:hypothetical protein